MSRTSRLIVRLTEDEEIAFQDAAKVAGISVSAWSRQHLRLAAIQELSRVGRRAVFLKNIPLKLNGNRD